MKKRKDISVKMRDLAFKGSVGHFKTSCSYLGVDKWHCEATEGLK